MSQGAEAQTGGVIETSGAALVEGRRRLLRYVAPAVPLAAAVILVLAGVGWSPPRPVAIAVGTLAFSTALLSLSTSQPVMLRRGGLMEVLVRELERSRRHGHQFTLFRVQGAEGHAVAVASAARSIDHAWIEDGSLYLLLPETRRSGAQVVARRIADVARDAKISFATFPDDGLTERALLKGVSSNGQRAGDVLGNGHRTPGGA